ncbi:sensor domain-containing diguanylate cyclase [Kiloniella sp. b19]|uniref:sensor domain-containing diguanylate cyclase n=1 Tax=Kiloniella sp. GXU_MW_B19 TaxID=3141326 RepID=UPI0031E10898
MTTHTKLNDEAGRLSALHRYDVLDTPEEQPFENVVNLVQQTLQVPMCAVSLVDEHRQWFKARRGLGVCETGRDISFCTHAIQQTDPFIVNNAEEDPLFMNNPLVTEDPHIRSYLGIPLQTPEGYNIGSLCGIDIKPRDFQPHEVEIMKSFARIVVDELELRQIASSDALTGAMTRRAWCEIAEGEIKRAHRYKRKLSLAILDIDHFKHVNDTYGHPVGDRVIQFLANLCIDEKRESDFFGRYGGEEFVFLITETGEEESKNLLERIRKNFQDSPIPIGGGETIHCSISAGIASLREKEFLPPLLERADQRLYQAKETGRNRVVVYSN